MKTYSLNDALFDESGQRWVPAPVAQGLYEALKQIDRDLEGRNFLENSSLRDTARAALAAADKEGRCST